MPWWCWWHSGTTPRGTRAPHCRAAHKCGGEPPGRESPAGGALAELAPVARLNESAVALYFHSLVFSAPARSALRRYPTRRPYASSSSVYPCCTLLIRTCYFMGVAWYANREDKAASYCRLVQRRSSK